MKKTLMTIFILTAIAFSAAAVSSANELKAMDRLEYNRKALTVSVYNTYNMTGGTYIPITKNFDLTVFSGEQTVKWIAFQGNRKLTKPEFYSLAGYPEEARRYESFKRSKTFWSVFSWVAVAAGAASFSFGENIAASPGEPQCNLKTALMISGTGLCLAAVFGFVKIGLLSTEEQQFSVGFATNIADGFNATLLAQYEY